MNKILKITAITLAIAATALGYSVHQLNKPLKLESTTEAKISIAEYQKVLGELTVTLNTKNPKAAIEELKTLSDQNPLILRSCHSFAHELGHAAYKKYNDFAIAMSYQDELCASGYIHGVVESSFTKSANIFSTLNTVCEGADPGKFFGQDCYHGVGHGLMYFTDNNLPKALEYCHSYKDGEAASSCVNGVFMENFNTDQKAHVSEYLHEDDPFYPCAEQGNVEDKNLCYLYAPTYFLDLNGGDYVSALNWCQGAAEEFRHSCYVGVGNLAIKRNPKDPKKVEELCMTQEGEARAQCIYGLVTYFINYHGNLASGQELCKELKIINRKACGEGVTNMSRFF